MGGGTRLYVGTRKGGFRFCSHDGRKTWMAEEPVVAGWGVFHMIEDPRDPARIYAAANHEVWGSKVARSADGGRTWEEHTDSPAFPVESGASVKNLWFIRPGHAERPGEVWAGVDPGALFRSQDWGANWAPVASLNEHATRPLWQAGGGGLCLHGVSLDPHDPDSLIATISAGGSFRTDDGGETWRPINGGLAADFMPDPAAEAGHCVHKLVRSPQDSQWLFQQNHCGQYRSSDGGGSWIDVTKNGLPSGFGFPAAIHPHEPHTVYVAPLKGDDFRVFSDGAAAVWRSRDGGDSWEPLRRGLPQQNAYLSVLRTAMTTDGEDPAGVYMGTSTGQIFHSRDGGDSWELMADYLPPILSLETATS